MPTSAMIYLDVSLFTGMTEAETRLLDAVADLPNSLRSLGAREKQILVNGPVRAGLIQLVLLNGKVARALDRRELNLSGVLLMDTLDLSFATIPFPLTFERWSARASLKMHHAHFVHLKLDGGFFRDIVANGIVVDSDLAVEHARIRGALSLERARIGGSLRLSGSHLCNRGETALSATGSVIRGSVEMTHARCVGAVELNRAQITGNLGCRYSEFYAPRRSLAQARRVARAAEQLDHGTTAGTEGGRLAGPQSDVPVHRLGATAVEVPADGPRMLRKRAAATLRRLSRDAWGWRGRVPRASRHRTLPIPLGIALNAEFVEVGGAVRLVGVRTLGELHMLNLKCGVDMSFSSAVLRNPWGDALSLDQSNVTGAIFLRNVACYGCIRIAGAQVGLDLDMGGMVLVGPEPRVGTTRSKLQARAAEGANAEPKDEPFSLLANRARIIGNVFMNNHFVSIGLVSLSGAHVIGQVVCEDAALLLYRPTPHMERWGKRTLALKNATVDGSVTVTRATTDGIMDFRTLTVGRNLHLKSVRCTPSVRTGYLLENARVELEFALTDSRSQPGMKLVLSHAQIGRIRHGYNSWPLERGDLKLDGCTYTNIDFDESDGTRRQFSRFPKWKSLLNFTTAWWPDASVAIEWLKLIKSDSFDPQPFEQLAGVRRREGENDARQILINMERERLSHTTDWARRVAGAVTGALLQHGYTTRRVWTISIVWIAFAAVLFGQAKRASILTVAESAVYMDTAYRDAEGEPSGYPRFLAVIYSLDSFLPIIDLHQESYWIPNARRACRLEDGTRVSVCGWLFSGFLWFHIVMGWWASSLIALALTGAIRRAHSE